MTMLADHADFVIGVDTHKGSHTAVVLSVAGARLSELTVAATGRGYKQLLAFASEHVGRRVWAVEGSGSYGAGLATHLLRQGERVVEIDRPKRPAKRNGSKSDLLDAERAAREVFAREHLAQPRLRGDREAMSVLVSTRQGAVAARTSAINHLKDLVVKAPEELRQELRPLATMDLIRQCAGMRARSSRAAECQATVMAMRSASRRILALGAEAEELEAELEHIVARVAPQLLAQAGASAQLPRRKSCAPGRTPAASVQKQPSLRWPARRPSRLRQVRRSDTASTAAATASSIALCTPWPSHALLTTHRPGLTPLVEPRRGRVRGRLSGA